MSPEGFFVGERKVTDDGEVHGLFRAWIKSATEEIKKYDNPEKARTTFSGNAKISCNKKQTTRYDILKNS